MQVMCGVGPLLPHQIEFRIIFSLLKVAKCHRSTRIEEVGVEHFRRHRAPLTGSKEGKKEEKGGEARNANNFFLLRSFAIICHRTWLARQA